MECVFHRPHPPCGGQAFIPQLAALTRDVPPATREDALGGIDFAQARFYDPLIGRFLSPDTIYDGGLADPQGLNRYSYVKGRVLNATDPTGQWCLPILNIGDCIPVASPIKPLVTPQPFPTTTPSPGDLPIQPGVKPSSVPTDKKEQKQEQIGPSIYRGIRRFPPPIEDFKVRPSRDYMGISFSEASSGGPANMNNMTGRWDEQQLTKNGFAVDHDEGKVYIIDGIPVAMPPGHVSVKVADEAVWVQIVANPDGEVATHWRTILAGLTTDAQPNPNKKK